MEIQISSLNVRGIGEKQKRSELFNWLRSKKISLYLLQEVHCSNDTISIWSSEWGYKSLFSCCSSAKGGVAILFNNNFSFQILRLYLDTNGRFIICDIETEGKCITCTLATLYAPNEDEPSFFQDFFDHLSDFQCDDLIIGGDFNLILDLDKDKKKGGRYKTHTRSVKMLKEFIARLDLIDAWRVLNPKTLRYIWRRKKPDIQCGLDFFLVSQSLMCNVTHDDITMGFKTDHSLITISAALLSNQRGPGYWKLNTSFLSDANYVNQLRATIQKVTDEYVTDYSVNPTLLWKMIELKNREQSIKYAKDRRTKTSRREEQIEKAINDLQELIESSNKGDREKKRSLQGLEEKKTELEKIIEYRTKGAILRAKCRWHNEGERNTKYFLNLEKRHFKNGVISQLKIGENEFVTSDKEILHQCENFYRDLYKSRISKQQSEPSSFNFFEDTNISNADEKESCEGLLTNSECLQALQSMEPEKTLGSDGIPAEFYKIFWDDISEHLVTSINHAYQKEQFSVTQRRGIIKLIPKKDTEPYLIKNWRPITLLNCDYKISAKALASHLKKVLPKLVNSDQTGFMKGRFIGENIRLIDGVINFAEVENIPGLLLFLDFQKAFDTVE